MISHKKLIVPVVALMLCAVAVVGVGFAYNGQYRETSPEVNVDGYSIMVDKTSGVIKINETSLDVKFNTFKSDSADRTYKFDKTQTISVDGVEANVTESVITIVKTFDFTVKSSDNGATGTFTVAVTGIEDSDAFVTKSVKIEKDSQVVSNGDSFTLADGSSSVVYRVTLTLSLNANKVTDDNVNTLVIPEYTVTATAAKSS